MLIGNITAKLSTVFGLTEKSWCRMTSPAGGKWETHLCHLRLPGGEELF